MRKVLAVAASAALCCFALTGCASGTPSTSQSASSAQTSSATASQSAASNSTVTADDVVVIPAESTISDYSRYLGKRVDVTGTVTGIDASTFTVDRNGVTFTCTPLNANSLQHIKAGSPIEIEGTISSATDGAVTLDNVTIDDTADDYYDMDDRYDRDYDDLYNDDFDDDELFDYDD